MRLPPNHALRFEHGTAIDVNPQFRVDVDISAEKVRADGSIRTWCALSATVDNKIEVRFGDGSATALDGTQLMTGYHRYPVVAYIPTNFDHLSVVCSQAGAVLIIGWLDWQ